LFAPGRADACALVEAAWAPVWDPLPHLWGRVEGGWGPGGWPRRIDKRGRRDRLAGSGLLPFTIEIVKAPRPGWVCVLGGGLRRPLSCLRFRSLIFPHSGTTFCR